MPCPQKRTYLLILFPETDFVLRDFKQILSPFVVRTQASKGVAVGWVPESVSRERWVAVCGIVCVGLAVLCAFFRCFKNFLQNFGDESQFWWFWDFGIDFKILKKSCDACAPILGPILENFDWRILLRSQSYDKPPWRNFDFWSNFVEIENFGF